MLLQLENLATEDGKSDFHLHAVSVNDRVKLPPMDHHLCD